MEFRDLTANDIEVRVQQVKEKGVSLLLYKNARVDMNILDETVGVENWQREHYECKGNLFCRVGINTNYKDDTKQPNWIWKSDCGTESNTEAQKGESSDSFKRSCTNFGIGRELYTAPFLWVDNSKCNIIDTSKKDKYNKPVFTCKDKFIVEAIRITNKRITALALINTTTGKRCLVWQEATNENQV